MKGRKQHVVTDSLGLVIGAAVHSANVHDSKDAMLVADQQRGQLLDHPLVTPLAKIIIDGLPRPVFRGERPPLRARAQHVKEGSERLPHTPFPLPLFAVYDFFHNFKYRVRLVGQAVFTTLIVRLS